MAAWNEPMTALHRRRYADTTPTRCETGELRWLYPRWCCCVGVPERWHAREWCMSERQIRWLYEAGVAEPPTPEGLKMGKGRMEGRETLPRWRHSRENARRWMAPVCWQDGCCTNRFDEKMFMKMIVHQWRNYFKFNYIQQNSDYPKFIEVVIARYRFYLNIVKTLPIYYFMFLEYMCKV